MVTRGHRNGRGNFADDHHGPRLQRIADITECASQPNQRSGWMTKHRGSRSATRELAICFQHRPATCQVDLRGRASAVPDNDIATNAISVGDIRSEEQTSELQSLMRNSYAVYCLK